NGVALASGFHTAGQRDHRAYNIYVAKKLDDWVKQNQGTLMIGELVPKFRTDVLALLAELRDKVTSAYAQYQAVAKQIEEDIKATGKSSRKAPSLDDAVRTWK
ncbi:MAG TPA: hypothetical protein VF541_02055, partial [Longimicrobium sp.]